MILGTLYGNTSTCPDLKFYATLRNSKQMADIFVGFQLMPPCQFICKMGHKGALSQTEKSKIVERLPKNISTVQIAKELDCSHRIFKKFVTNPALCNGRCNKGKIRKKAPVSHRAMSIIKREVRRNPLETRKKVFENACVPDVAKSTRCRILKSVAKCGKPEVRPPLKDIHMKKRMEWARNHMTVNVTPSYAHLSTR